LPSTATAAGPLIKSEPTSDLSSLATSDTDQSKQAGNGDKLTVAAWADMDTASIKVQPQAALKKCAFI